MDRSFFRFVTTHAFDRQTDGHMDRPTDQIFIAKPRLHCMQRGKNLQSPLSVKFAVRNVQFNALEHMDNISPRANRCGILFYERELAFTFAIVVGRPSVVCLSSVTFVRPTQPVEFSALFLCHLVPWPSVDSHRKVYEDRPRETLRRRGLGKRRMGSQI